MKCVDIPEWLKGLPLAPEFRPTETEFADPIAYISKIEKEACVFGICKVIPPLPKPSKKYVLHNLNKSLSKCPDLGNVEDSGQLFRAVFTTRHQELGHSEKKKLKGAIGAVPLGAQKQVWQSGQLYTLEQFETKSKNFARTQLGMVKEISPLAVEARFWKAASEEPIYVEYANDVPGSAFGDPEGLFNYFRRRRARKRKIIDRNSRGSSGYKIDEVGTSSNSVVKGPCHGVETPSTSSSNSSPFMPKGCSNAGEMEGSAGWKLANSPWNLQVIARSPGSLTRFMPDDIPGVTSPMIYIGMLFSWFAWHVEDHELHSLNFLHTGSPKTWYAVPGDYAFSFEEVIRCHAYGENTDPLAALTLLGEKTTLLSPEVLVASDIPCCRLVQNPGEFVVTFPRAYHVGFSHVDRIERNGVHFLNHDEVSLSAQPSKSAVSLHGGQTSQSHHLSHTDNAALTSKVDLEKECDGSRGFVRPQIFCLEHAIQTEELLRTKGGANVLVICHSDFQKIRGHAAIIAEETGTAFKYNEIPLANASQGHLSVIDLAIGDEEQDKCAEDWTLKLNINLRHCVKVQRNCPLKKLKHALILGGLFSDTTRSSDSLSLNWQSRKVRSKRKSNNSKASTPVAKVKIQKVVDSGSKMDMQNAGKGNITIQYSRKNYKPKACSSADVARVFVDPFNVSKEEVSLADAKTLGSTLLRDENADTSSLAERFIASSDGNSQLRHEHEMLLVNRDQNGNLLAPQEADLLVTTSLMVEFDEAQAEVYTSQKFPLEDKTCDTNSNSSHTERKTTAVETSGETEIAHVHTPACTSIYVVQSTAYNENLEENRDITEAVIRDKSAHPTEADFERDHHSGDGKAIMTGSPVSVNSSGSCTDGPSRSCDEQNEDQVSKQFGSGSEASDSETQHKSVEQEIQIDNSDQHIAVSDHVTPIEEVSASAGSPKMTRETSSTKHSQSGEEISERHKKESNDNTNSAIVVSRPTGKSGGKRRREPDLLTDDGCSVGGFAKSPCEGLRPRARKNVPGSRADTKEPLEKKPTVKRSLPSSIIPKDKKSSITPKSKKEQRKGTHRCDMDGCWMSFQTKVELQVHKHNRCPVEGCEKKFTSHKYALVHQRVHENDRPLKCPWKGCTMTFKWTWARTEHLRVHTGERPYKCKVEGCGLTFRFVSDYSRHRRKTGHYVDAAN